MKRTAYILILFLVMSCGTLKPRDHIMAIDSSPRGETVYDDQKTKIGKTPFFHKVEPQWSKTYYFGKEKTKIKSHCSLAWSRTIIPDTLVSALPGIGLILGPLAIGTDIYTGEVFDCEQMVSHQLKEGLDYSSPELKVLILPFQAETEELSNKVIKDWYENKYGLKFEPT